jgi:hypothetical protein
MGDPSPAKQPRAILDYIVLTAIIAIAVWICKFVYDWYVWMAKAGY